MVTAKSNVKVAPTATETSVAGVVSVLKAVRKHWAIVVACTLVAGGASLLYSKSVEKIYEASSLIEIGSRASQPLGTDASKGGSLDLGVSLFWDPSMYYQTQYKIISSAPVLKRAVTALSLQNDYEFFGLKVPPAQPMSLDLAVEKVRGSVLVEAVKGSSMATIKVTDPDPKRAKRICDAIASAYVELNLETAVDASSEAVVWLDGQIDHLKKDLEGNENALYEFKEKNDLPSISINDASNMLRQEMQQYDEVLTHSRTRREELLARKAELATLTADNPDDIPASELLANLYLQTLRTQYREAFEQLVSLRASGKGDNHPLVKEAAGKLEDARKALLNEIHNVQDGVARDLAVVERQVQGEAELYDQARRRAVDLNMKEIEYHRLDRSRDENEKIYSLLIERMKETDLARMMRTNNLRIVEAAVAGAVPIRPRTGVNFAVGLIAGFLLGFAIAWLREQLDSSIKTPDDIEHKLGLTFLGLLPAVEDVARPRRSRRHSRANGPAAAANTGPPELIVHRRPVSGAAEAARTIRTNLMFMNPDKPYKTMLVASAAPAEGKTTVACSLAISLAQGGQRVCLVDCDLRRPRIHRIFGRRLDIGVTSVLVGDATIEQVALPTEVDGLWSVPAGPLPPNPADLLHSERFRRFVRELGERFDRVILDSPPLVAVTDSAIISTVVDAVVFVIRAFKTGKYLSAQGLRALYDVEAPLVGAVLNAVNLDHHEYSYYYYFYYKRDGYRGPNDPSLNEPQAAGASPPN
jgi:capsular exopolysaccharide synthesis family protein